MGKVGVRRYQIYLRQDKFGQGYCRVFGAVLRSYFSEHICTDWLRTKFNVMAVEFAEMQRCRDPTLKFRDFYAEPKTARKFEPTAWATSGSYLLSSF